MALTLDRCVAQCLAQHGVTGRVWVAYSGGCDSHVLLSLAVQWAASQPAVSLGALHVNHGLLPQADAWARHCQHVCDGLGIPLITQKVTVADDGRGLESAARQARYDAFEQSMEEQDWLLQGHHQDDQAETVLYRLLRGAGPRGLSGIPRYRRLQRGHLLRPLLSCPQSTLRAWAVDHELHYIVDPSNDDVGLDRNYLRAEVLPRIAERWPGFRETISRAAGLQGSVEQWMRQQGPAIVRGRFGEPYFTLQPSEDIEQLCWQLSTALLEWGWRVPPAKRLREFARQCRDAGAGKLPRLTLADGVLHGWRGRCYFEQIAEGAKLPKHLAVGEAQRLGRGILTWSSPESGNATPTLGLPESVALEVLSGRDVLPFALINRPRKTFKQWCHEWDVPPWLRPHLPLLGRDGVVLAVPHFGLTREGRALAVVGGVQPQWCLASQIID